MAADRVGAVAGEVGAGLAVVGVVGPEDVAVRVAAAVGAAGGALPLDLAAQAGAGDTAGRGEPGGERLGVGGRDAGHRQPVARVRAIAGAVAVAERLAERELVALGRRLEREPPAAGGG